MITKLAPIKLFIDYTITLSMMHILMSIVSSYVTSLVA